MPLVFERVRGPDTYPVGPVLTMYDPIYLGVDEFGQPVYIRIIYRNLLAGGEPGGGKSGLLNTITAHAALSAEHPAGAVRRQASRTRHVGRHRRRIRRPRPRPRHHHPAAAAAGDGQPLHLAARLPPPQDRAPRPLSVIVAVFDEIALYSATLGTEQQQKQFIALLRDLVARGRAAGIIVIAATQRPSVDIIPKSLRDIFGYRAAFRCTSSGSSNIILGDGWSEAGFSATDILPTNQGAALPHRRRRRPPPHQSRLPVRLRHHQAGRLRGLDPQAPCPARQHSPHRHTLPDPDNPDA